MIKIIEYNGNKEVLVNLIEELQDYLVQIDPLQRLRRLPEYGDIYINNTLKKIEQNHGIIYIAEFENIPVGIIAGIIEESSEEEKLECIPSKVGIILELIVSEKYRGKNIGSLLMKQMEEYFQIHKCNIISVDIFEPNKKTHNFYQKLGYQDRLITMIKKIL